MDSNDGSLLRDNVPSSRVEGDFIEPLTCCGVLAQSGASGRKPRASRKYVDTGILSQRSIILAS